MKRILSIIFIFVFTFSYISVYADDFTLRNDIHFGDSIETVKEKETLEIKEDSLEEDENDKSIKYLKTSTGDVADIPYTSVTYTFKDDKLIDMKYDFTHASFYMENDEITKRLATVYAMLNKKYGFEYDSGTIDDSYFKTSVYDKYLNYKERMDDGEPCQILNFNGCFLDNDDYGVKIEALTVFIDDPELDYQAVYPYVGYRYISPDEIEEYNAKVKEYNNQLDNDL